MSDTADNNDKIQPDDMVGVPIEEFISGLVLPVSVYVRLSDTKFVKVAHEGGQTRIESLAFYQNKKVDKLWVRKSEHNKITELQVRLAEAIFKMPQMAYEQKADALAKATAALFEQIHISGLDENIYYIAKRITEVTLKLVEGEKDISRLITAFNLIPNELVRHSMAVSAFSVFVAAVMDWKKPEVLQKLAMGGLLHDIGKIKLPASLLSKTKDKYNEDEMKQYRSHCEIGRSILSGVGAVHSDVIAIVYEHHEGSATDAFPQGLRDYRMNPLAKVCALANGLAGLTIKNVENPIPVTPFEAVIYIESVMGQPYSKDLFKAVKNYIMAPMSSKKPA